MSASGEAWTGGGLARKSGRGGLKVFISYRRADNPYLAETVRAALTAAVGSSGVFLDVGAIPPGVDLTLHIRAALAGTDLVLALIGPYWLPGRLDDPADFVRLELTCAHELGITVVPVLHSGRSIPAPTDLPEPLRWLSGRRALVLRPPPDHDHDLRELVRFVADTQRAKCPSTDGSSPSPLRQTSLDFINESNTMTSLRGVWNRMRQGEER